MEAAGETAFFALLHKLPNRLILKVVIQQVPQRLVDVNVFVVLVDARRVVYPLSGALEPHVRGQGVIERADCVARFTSGVPDTEHEAGEAAEALPFFFPWSRWPW